MQEDKTLETRTDEATTSPAGRHRSAGRATRRSTYLVPVAVSLVGFGLAGVAADVTPSGGTGHPDLTAAVATDELSRAQAADRADRSDRQEPTPAAASASPTAQAENEPVVPPPEPRPDWVNPMPGAGVTSCYGPRWGTMHAGIDLAAPENTPIFAAGAGEVVAAGWTYRGYGISVVIDHGNGYLTHYAHQNKADVQVGQQVATGDLIGWEGSTGDSTGPHLHFEVHNGLWNQVDPAPWLRARGVDLGC